MSNAYDVHGNIITGAIPRRFVDNGPQKRLDHIRAHTPIVRTERKIGRNEPCPCRSGKKFKKCHGVDING